MVLPDGFFFGEGMKTRLKEKLLEECNLHTIVRLPNGVFNPYTGIKTNLLFFTKGQPTEQIWYYEHPYPEGVKSYNKTKPMRFEEFQTEIDWWGSEADGFAERVETEQAWKVSIDEIKARNYNLDIKNPHVGEQVNHDPDAVAEKICPTATGDCPTARPAQNHSGRGPQWRKCDVKEAFVKWKITLSSFRAWPPVFWRNDAESRNWMRATGFLRSQEYVNRGARALS